MFKRLFLLALAFTVSLSAFSVLLPDTAKAVSPYDDIVKQLPPADMKITDYQAWTGIWNPSATQTFTPFNFGQWIGGDAPFYASTTCAGYSREQIIDAVNNRPYGIYQTVSNPTGMYTGNYLPNMYIAMEGEFETNWLNDRLNLRSTKTIVLTALTYEGDRWISCSDAGNTWVNYAVKQFTGGSGFEYYYSHRPVEQNFNLSYPDGYEGETIEPISTGDVFAPQIGYATTTENVIKALYSDGTSNSICIPVGLVEETGCVQPLLRWVIKDQGGTELVSTVKQLYEPFEFKFPSYAMYTLEASYVHPGTPWAPFAPDVVLQTTVIKINANGTFVVGSTDLNECSTINGQYVCEQASPFEDCSTYAGEFPFGIGGGTPPDVVGGFQCTINNFGVWLRNLLIDLFIPNSLVVQQNLNRFSSSLEEQFGFLYTSMSMIISWLNAILTIQPQCYVDMGNAQFFGATIDIDFCSFEKAAPNIYIPLVTIARLVLAAGFIFIGYRRLLEITKGLGR